MERVGELADWSLGRGEVCFVGRAGSMGLVDQGGAGGARLRMAFQWYLKATAGTPERERGSALPCV